MQRNDLRAQALYWVRVRRSIVIDRSRWEPARFTGFSGDSDGPATWDFLGHASADGHHHIEVLEVGQEINRG